MILPMPVVMKPMILGNAHVFYMYFIAATLLLVNVSSVYIYIYIYIIMKKFAIS
jgi:hypothetical protein